MPTLVWDGTVNLLAEPRPSDAVVLTEASELELLRAILDGIILTDVASVQVVSLGLQPVRSESLGLTEAVNVQLSALTLQPDIKVNLIAKPRPSDAVGLTDVRVVSLIGGGVGARMVSLSDAVTLVDVPKVNLLVKPQPMESISLTEGQPNRLVVPI